MNQTLLKAIKVPAFLIVFFGTLYLTWFALGLPPEEIVTSIARSYFDRFGLLTILVSSFLEGLFVVGWYFPGTTVIVLCLVLSGTSLASSLTAALTGALGLFAAYTANYFIGRYGWYRLLLKLGFKDSIEWGKSHLSRHGLSSIALTYWQFTLASTISTAAGIMQFSLPRFLVASAISVTFWSAFYWAIIYFLGTAAMNIVGVRFIIALASVWIVMAVALHFYRNRQVQR